MDQYSQQVLRTALHILQDPQGAMDVHQEVFLDVLKRWHRFDGDVRWSSYLYRVTIRMAIKQAKAMRKAGRPVMTEQDMITRDRPETALVAQELQQKLAECLSKLPTRQAEVFVLHRIEGLSYQAIAELLSCSESTVRVHLCRALKYLTKRMQSYQE